jgi:DNA invertase Pin-like site-specific DNA recombinase
MNQETPQKVRSTHLKRKAYLYIRQSTPRQVLENRESTQRQYALRQRAVALGWPEDQIVVIDHDLGHSGASAADHKGFQQLVTEVSLGRAGIVLGLEVSRLARNSTDWHRLLEICALTEALILDEDGVYDPAHFNDRLLLGLKGTMSEAELHVLRARLRGGILNKARRGELLIQPPIGLLYNSEGVLGLDPDKQVQQSLRFLFDSYRRSGSATAIVKAFRKQGLLFPRRVRGGPQRGELVWGPLGHCQVLRILHNPRYAGAFVFGRHRVRKTVDGQCKIMPVPQDDWETLIPEAQAGYLTWEDYEQNQKRLRESAQAIGAQRKSAAREGPALLQGLVLCGRCGERMTVRYHVRHGHSCPDYVCQRAGIETAQPACQHVPGCGIDQAIGELLVEALSPVALEVALNVQQELQSRLEEADGLRRQQVERAQYEADLARRRYMCVDPANRLVADSLEAEWNSKLRALSETQQERERQRQQDRQVLSDQQRAAILALAADFPRLWRDPNTPDRERKRMTRFLLEDVTLLRADNIVLHVRFKGGVMKTLTVPIPLNAWQQRTTSRDIVQEIDRLLEHHTVSQIASLLNERGTLSGERKTFTPKMVARIRRKYGLTSRYDRLRTAGLLSMEEVAALLQVKPHHVRMWQHQGVIRGHPYSDKNEYLYEHPGDNPLSEAQALNCPNAALQTEIVLKGTKEVQYEA